MSIVTQGSGFHLRADNAQKVDTEMQAAAYLGVAQ